MAKLMSTLFWTEFRKTHPDADEQYQSWSFGDSETQADELAKLVLAGEKKATSSLYQLYRWTNEPIPKAGSYSIILDGSQQPVCIIQTTKVEVIPYHDVNAEQAQLEGEGDLSLDYWREVHWQFFSHQAAAASHHFSENDPIVYEYFQVVARVEDLMK